MTMIAIDVLFPRLGSHKSLQVAITVPKFNDIEIELFYGYSGSWSIPWSTVIFLLWVAWFGTRTVNYTDSTRRWASVWDLHAVLMRSNARCHGDLIETYGSPVSVYQPRQCHPWCFRLKLPQRSTGHLTQ